MSESDCRAIEKLIYTYAELVDTGDFAGIGALLAEATFIGGSDAVAGRETIAESFARTVIRYPDGTPRTRHLVTNIVVDIHSGLASARSSFTALQALPELPLQPIASGRYRDRFALRDGRWFFTERRVLVDLAGNLGNHIYAR